MTLEEFINALEEIEMANALRNAAPRPIEGTQDGD
jgi:hypothetical protein